MNQSRAVAYMDETAIFAAIIDWANAEPTVEAVALVGSRARGTARADSDIDLVVLTSRPEAFREDAAWLNTIRWHQIGTRPMRWVDEDYGALWSRRVWLGQSGLEIEFGFVPLSWANIDPVDQGTRIVISDGCLILYDPRWILKRINDVVNATAF